MENQPAAKKMYVGKFGGHEHACRPSISNQIGTNRIPMIKSIILNYQNMILTYPRVGIRAKYWKIWKNEKKHIFFFVFWSFLVSNNMKMMYFCIFHTNIFFFQIFLKNGFEPTKICRILWRFRICGPNEPKYNLNINFYRLKKEKIWFL